MSTLAHPTTFEPLCFFLVWGQTHQDLDGSLLVLTAQAEACSQAAAGQFLLFGLAKSTFLILATLHPGGFSLQERANP